MASVDEEWALFQKNFDVITQRMQSSARPTLPSLHGAGMAKGGDATELVTTMSALDLKGLYVSTMVILSYVSAPLDVDAFRAWVEANGQASLALPHPCKLVGIKPRKEPKKESKKTGFFFSKAYQVQLGTKTVVVTLFADGILHLTGVKQSEDAETVCRFMLDVLQSVPGVVTPKKEASGTAATQPLTVTKTQVALMNAQFAVPFFVDRQALYGILRAAGLQVFFDPMVYQGVRVTLLWNKHKDGRCHCETPCKTHGKSAARTCMVVTASIFRTGKVNIMGGKGETQVVETARLLDGILRSQRSELEIKAVA